MFSRPGFSYDPPMDPGYAPVADAIRERMGTVSDHTLVVGVAGSVCVGKSTTCDRIRTLLHAGPVAPRPDDDHHADLPVERLGRSA